MARPRVTRREFLTAGALAGAGLAVAPPLSGRVHAWRWFQGGEAVPAGWGRVDAILARIADPVFPDRAFDVTKHGAAGDGARDCTGAFRAAVDACAAAGGGHVVVPAGRFLTGPIHLKSGVDLHVSDGATIAFSRDPETISPSSSHGGRASS